RHTRFSRDWSSDVCSSDLPEVGELENPVFIGKQYMLKLQHQTGKKFSARGQGPYTMDEQPARGGDKSGQALDILTNYTLLAHGEIGRASCRERGEVAERAG